MATPRRIGIALLVGLLLAAAVPVLADGSLFGTLAVKVRDESGGALPGAAIELTNPGKGVRRSATSDASGVFNFALLPPGTYTVTARLEGFEAVESKDHVVSAEKTTTVTIPLRLARAEASVVVIGQSQLVDKTNTSDTTVVKSELTDKLPIGRAYQNVVDFAPGQNDIDGDGNPNAHGAPDSANVFLFDGVDTTDPTTGTFGANNNFDTIEEVVVSNAAISAEYGRVQGAVVNVITKSGTNDFHGSARALMTNDSLNADNKGTNPFSGQPWNRNKLDQNVYDYIFTLGGPVVRDRLWFFGSYERNPQSTPEAQTETSPIHPDQTGEGYSADRTFTAWQGKLNAQIAPSHALSFFAQADPFTGIINDYWGAAAELEALTLQDQSNDCPWACIWQARYSGVFGANVSAELTYAGQRGGIGVGPYDGTGSAYINLSDGLVYNGNPYIGFVERPRNQGNAALNYYTTIADQSHNFKVGVDYQDIESTNSFILPNNEYFFVTDFDPVSRQPILSEGDLWFQGTTPAPSTSSGSIWGIYLLDRFDLSNRLSFNLGMRVDIQEAQSDLQQAIVNTTNVSPRLSVSYDVAGNGKTILSGAYGRYYEFLAQTIVDSIYSGVPQQTNFDVFQWNGAEWEFAYPLRVGGNTQPVNPDLSPSYVDEFNIALQQQLGTSMAVGVRGIYREWNNIVDDIKVVNADGDKILTPINFSNDIIFRNYKAIELTFNRRFSKNFQALASYTLSEVEGNTDRSYALTAFTSQLLDYPEDTCVVPAAGNLPEVSGPCPEILGHNQSGVPPWDITNSVKIYTAYTIPFSFMNLTAAPSFTWFSGLPYQRQRLLSIEGDTDVYNDDPAGSSRLEDWYQINFSLEAAFPLFSAIELALKADVFNVTNQQPVIDNSRISLLPDENFGKPNSRLSFNAPRGYQFGAVVRF